MWQTAVTLGHCTTTINPSKCTDQHRFYSSPVMCKITDHHSVRATRQPQSQQAILQSGEKIGSVKVLRAIFDKVSGCIVQREKIHKNVEQLIYHLLHGAYTSVHSPAHHLKHISSSPFWERDCVCGCVYVVLLPWWGSYLPYLKPFYSQSIDIFSHVSFWFWIHSYSSFYRSPLTLSPHLK